LKCRIHATLMSFGHTVPVTDLFGNSGRELLAGFELPEPWARTLATSLAMLDELDERIDECGRELTRLGADHLYIPLLLTVPGVGPLLAYTIASEIGDIGRFASPKKLTGYTGLCPIVRQSGNRDVRGPLAKNGPKYLRWAWWRRPPTPLVMSTIGIATSGTSTASDASVAPRSPGRHRPPAGRGHLARPHEERTVCPGKPRYDPGRLTTPVWNWAAGAASHATLSFITEGHREMSAARYSVNQTAGP